MLVVAVVAADSCCIVDVKPASISMSISRAKADELLGVYTSY